MAEFVTVGQVSAIPPGKVKQVKLRGKTIALWHVDGTIYAVGDICTHEECDISDGGEIVSPHRVECPCHGAQFDLATGKALALPATEPLPTYPVRIEGDDIQIAI